MATETVLPQQEELSDLVPGPGSITWRVAGDIRLLGAAGYALLLQVAHPTVGAGVTEHSNFAADPWGRLLRTLDYVNGTIYGGPRLAGEIGRRVREMHKDIKGVKSDGERYHALEPEAYAWVHATLAASMVDGQRWLATPLTTSEAEEFWAQWRRLGRLVGVRDRDLPETWAEFGPYFAETVSRRLENTVTVHEVLDALGRPTAPPGLPDPIWRVLRVPLAQPMRLSTVGLLGPELRERFGLNWTTGHDRAFRAYAALSRASTPLLLPQLRQFGPAYLRLRHKAISRGAVASGR